MANNMFDNADQIIADQHRRFDATSRMVRMTGVGISRSLIIAGSPGVGKTYEVERQLTNLENGQAEEAELGRQDPTSNSYRENYFAWRSVTGYTRATSLYMMLYEYRHQRNCLVLDDIDSVFRDENGLNILKAALDSKDVRKISWMSSRPLVKKFDDGTTETIPSTFDYKGSVIFLTNMDFDKMIEKKNRMSPHYDALVSRSHYIDIGITSIKERMIRVYDVAIRGGMLERIGLNEEETIEVIEFMASNMNKLREISLRMALKIGELCRADEDNWKTMAEVTCLKKA